MTIERNIEITRDQIQLALDGAIPESDVREVVVPAIEALLNSGVALSALGLSEREWSSLPELNVLARAKRVLARAGSVVSRVDLPVLRRALELRLDGLGDREAIQALCQDSLRRTALAAVEAMQDPVKMARLRKTESSFLKLIADPIREALAAGIQPMELGLTEELLGELQIPK
ncbi:MAG: hypothetical protein KDD44_05155 [Bdellovibrionales bacterium]|nr:hypothetical protein [Bdellovibrionales bacterium]